MNYYASDCAWSDFVDLSYHIATCLPLDRVQIYKMDHVPGILTLKHCWFAAKRKCNGTLLYIFDGLLIEDKIAFLLSLNFTNIPTESVPTIEQHKPAPPQTCDLFPASRNPTK